MPITAQHPAVVAFDSTHAYLIDPDWVANSAGEHSIDALRAMARTKMPVTYALIALALVGTGVTVIFREAVADLLPFSGDAAGILATLLLIVLFLILATPLVRRYNRVTNLEREFGQRTIGAPIGRVNNYIQGATDTTPGALLWKIACAYERMDQALFELDELYVNDPTAADLNELAKGKRRLLHEIETVESLVASHPGLSSDTASYREDATPKP